MKNLKLNQEGAGHILLILLFVVALAGLVGFAYTRINEKQAEQQPTSQQESATADSDDPDSEDNSDNENDSSDNENDSDDVADDDPSENLGDEV